MAEFSFLSELLKQLRTKSQKIWGNSAKQLDTYPLFTVRNTVEHLPKENIRTAGPAKSDEYVF